MRALVLLLLVPALSAAQWKPLRAGAYAADITPRQWPVRLIGGFNQPLVEKAHDPLHARAVVLDDGETKLAIVIVDSCYLPRALYDRAKARAEKATGIPAANMLMAATHSHSAPPSKPEGASGVELAYQKLLEEQIAEAVKQANKRLAPAQIGWTVRQEPDELNNRRWFLKPGTMPVNPFGNTDDKVKMNPGRNSPDLVKPAGPVDAGFTVIAIRSKSGKPIALIGNYSLHYVGGVPAGGVSADYFGEFARQVALKLNAGPEFVGIMANGTSADVNNIRFQGTEPRREPFEKIRLVAARMAESAHQAYQSASYQTKVKLAAVQKEHPVRYRKPTPQQIAWAHRTLGEPDDKKLPTNAKAYAGRVLRLHDGPAMADVLLQALRIGDLGLAAIPCEVFTEIGLEIKAKSPFATAATFELANGHYGYLPTPEQHALGGYETWMGTNLLERNASRTITATILDMFQQIRK